MSRRPETAKINLGRNRHVLNSRAALQEAEDQYANNHCNNVLTKHP